MGELGAAGVQVQQKPVSAWLQELTQNIEALDKEVHATYQALQPVLGYNDQPKVTVTGDAPEKEVCPMAAELRALAYRCEGIRYHLINVRQAVEL